jgi:hypothetical protein
VLVHLRLRPLIVYRSNAKQANATINCCILIATELTKRNSILHKGRKIMLAFWGLQRATLPSNTVNKNITTNSSISQASGTRALNVSAINAKTLWWEKNGIWRQ